MHVSAFPTLGRNEDVAVHVQHGKLLAKLQDINSKAGSLADGIDSAFNVKKIWDILP